MSSFRSPRCYLVYATAPEGTTLKAANAAFNAYCRDRSRGLVLFHDHFRELPGGGVAVFFLDAASQLAALASAPDLPGWTLRVHALIHSGTPSAFDEQIALTVESFAGRDWEVLQRMDRPSWTKNAREPIANTPSPG